MIDLFSLDRTCFYNRTLTFAIQKTRQQSSTSPSLEAGRGRPVGCSAPLRGP